MLSFTLKQINTIYDDVINKYPNECCGILLGERDDDGCRIVKNVIIARNVAEEQTRKKYFKIHADDISYAESLGEKDNYDIVGFYHSHTDCDAIASEDDSNFAIPGISYPIVSIRNGKIEELISWEKSWTDGFEKLKKERIEIRN